MIVYLIHWDADTGYGRHYLALAPSEAAINVQGPIPHGHGVRRAPAGNQTPPMGILADVWETTSPADARALLVRLRKQGSRARLCSVCNPGNARGSGGRWVDRS